MVQLVLELEDKTKVHWDRLITLNNVWVLDFGADSPRDLYVSWRDWGCSSASPLGSLSKLVLAGATVLDSPRVPPTGINYKNIVVQTERSGSSVFSPSLAAFADADASSSDGAYDNDGLRERIRERIDPSQRDTPLGRRLLNVLLRRGKVFGPLVSAECTEHVEFDLVGTPKPVSFKVPISRKANSDAAHEVLNQWVRGGICERVAWSEPAYGFVIVVPKANGKFRVTINPTGVNAATQKVDPEGGYMPSHMVAEAMKAGNQRLACTFDLSDAFLTLKLGDTAQKLSTFTTPLGKMRWKHGYFGWHSFPAVFQRTIMERVVLPALDSVPLAVILAWIDDLVVAAKTDDDLINAVTKVVDFILAIGGRLQLAKCNFLITRFDWCGVEVDLSRNEWRIAAGRVAALRDIPVPRDREALTHVLGVLRYYYWGVSDQRGQRERLGRLAKLDVPGIRLRDAWNASHTNDMRLSIDAIASGEWMMVYDPTQPVYVSTDASGNHGFSVVANQFDKKTGKMRPVAFYAKGWLSTQLTWTPQVKECYAGFIAATKIMPAYYPFADVIWLVDNKNLAANVKSEDLRVVRWMETIKCTGCITRTWIPGDFNTIADYASRAVQADPKATLSAEDQHELHVYALLAAVAKSTSFSEGEEAGPQRPAADAEYDNTNTVVHGHLHMAPMVSKIITAQSNASKEEQDSWTGPKYTKATLGGRQLVLFDNKLLVPVDSKDIKNQLLYMAHDELAHYCGSGRTLQQLRRQARVHWVNMQRDVEQYVSSCFKCALGKAESFHEAKRGELSPTIAPHVHHTWYADLKGPFPHGTGYLLVVIESLTRFVKLRYLPNNTAKEVNEELLEAIYSFGTSPVVLRTDGGPPFDSHDYKVFCEEHGITPVKGVPYHSQGQGLVEERFRGIASAIMATLGGKAPTAWYKGPLLGRLEGIINSTYVSSIGGSPSWALYGREPRTPLAASVDWTDVNFGQHAIELSNFTVEDYNNLIAAHHDSIQRAHGLVSLATSVAQALTKKTWDATHAKNTTKVGDWVLVLRAAPNRLESHFTGPYKVVTSTASFVTGRHYLNPDKGKIEGPWHVGRLVPFDMSRASPVDIVAHQLEEGNAVVEHVVGHRKLADGSYEYQIKWYGVELTTWLPSTHARTVTKVIEYATGAGLPSPGTEPKVPIAPAHRGKGKQSRR